MASVTFLGVHKPSALPFLVQEGILTADATTDDYIWTTYHDHGDEELVTTTTCVVWSSSGVIRRVFRLEREQQGITSALLTSFPLQDASDEFSTQLCAPLPAHRVIRPDHLFARPAPKTSSAKESSQLPSDRRSKTHQRALVIVLKQHAHVYFLDGPSHVINLGFDAVRAFSAPQGIILQRHEHATRTHSSVPNILSDQSNLFSSPVLPRTSGAPSHHRTSIGRSDEISLADFVVTPKPTTTDNLPLLFTLTGPYARVGQLVEAEVSNGKTPHSKETCLQPLSSDEELLYTSPTDETTCDSKPATRPLMLVVTADRRKGLYSVWYASYSETHAPDIATYEAAEEAVSRNAGRRSSLLTRATMSKEAASKSLRKDHKAIDPRGNRLQDIRRADSESVSRTDLATLETTLTSPGKSKTRDRTSSFLARAELSSHGQSPFTDLSQTPKNLRGSLRGSRRGQASALVHENSALRTSGPVTRSAAKARISLVESTRFSEDEEMDVDEDDDRTLLENAGATALSDPFSGQKKDLIMTRLFSRPLTELLGQHDLATLGNLKVFTVLEPDRPRLGYNDTRVMSICLMHTQSQSLTELCFKLLRVQEARDDELSGTFFVPDNDLLVRKHAGVLDAIRLCDGDYVRIVQLVQQNNDNPVLRLPPPWATIDERGALFALDSHGGTNHDIRFFLPERFAVTSPHGSGPSSSTGMHMEGGCSRRVRALTNAEGPGCIALVDDMETSHRLQFALKPYNVYVYRILDALRCVLPGLAGEAVQYTWWRIYQIRQGHSLQAEWDALIVTLFFVALGSSDINCYRNLTLITQQPTTLNSKQIKLARIAQQFATSAIGLNERAKPGWLPKFGALPDILGILHLLCEEKKLNTMSDENSCNVAPILSNQKQCLSPVMTQIASWLGYTDWVDFYQLEDEKEQVYIDQTKLADLSISAPQPSRPPSVHAWLEEAIQEETTTPFPSLSSIRLGSNGVRLIDTHIAPRTSILNHLICTNGRGQTLNQDSHTALLDQLNVGMIETLPETVAAYLRDMLRGSTQAATTTISSSVRQLIGREDLQLLEIDDIITQIDIPRNMSSVDDLDARSLAVKADELLLKGAKSPGQSGGDTLVDLIYRDDRRVREATLLLDYTRQPTSEYKPRTGSTDKQFLDEQKAHARLVYQRTMATPAGEGLHNFRTRHPLPTERIKIRTFMNSCLMMPSGQPFSAEILSEEKSGWAYFHSGASAGLRITGDAPGLDASWIILNKPDEVGVRHAGLLLGLGLNGHLRSIPRWLIFKYLTPKHDMTTIGLLLGTSASRLGTMDLMITKLLSVHVPRLLPPGAAELNLSSLTQTAGLMSIGLLYHKTQHRRMSEILVSEVENVDLDDSVTTSAETITAKNEGYRLAAGFALGLTNLGQGQDLRALNGMNIMERLLRIATRAKHTEVVHILDQATAGAVMAIAIIFMKSQDTALARKIAVPDTTSLIDYVRPDMLLLRALAEHLIMWNEIEPSNAWLWNSLPRSLKPNDRQQLAKVRRPLGSENLALYNILTGLCWAIALKTAGTRVIEGRNVILGIYDRIAQYAAARAKTYDEKLTRQTLLRCQHHLLLSAATVMAGSGDLEVFRRLRKQYGTITDPSVFGLHQATTMAIGVLFLGNGRYTFGTSDLAVAALVIAFYPIFPKDAVDNRAHLQAFRHFWTFAVEARCLVIRDYDTKQPVVCPIEYTLRNNNQILSNLAAPVVLPDPDTISYVATNSPDYYQVKLDFDNNPNHLTAFRKHQTIFVRRKPLLAQYTTTFSASLATATSTNVNMTSFATYILQKALQTMWSIIPEHAAGILPPQHNTDDLDIVDLENISSPRNHAHHNSKAGGHSSSLVSLVDPRTTAVDDALVLLASVESRRRDALMALRFLFRWAEVEARRGTKMGWIGEETVGLLRAALIRRASGLASGAVGN